MAYSTKITLYITKIDPKRNLCVDEIESYLSSCESISFEDFKRTYPDSEHDIRLSFADDEAELSHESGLAWNYARIDYTDGDNLFHWYYFLTSFAFIADQTISAHLVLDSINTFQWRDWLSDRTYIARALVRRWDSNGVQIADPVGEDVQGAIVKTQEGVFAPSRAYLIYRNSPVGEPALYATSESGIEAKGVTALPETTIDAKCFKDGQAVLDGYGLRYQTSAEDTIAVDYSSNGSSGHWTSSGYTSYLVYFAITVDSATGLHYGQLIMYGGSTLVHFAPRFPLSVTSPASKTMFSASTQDGATAYYGSVSSSHAMPTPAKAVTQPIADLDRTQADLTKIVEIPYAPNLSNQHFEIRADGVFLRFSDLEATLAATRTLTARALKALTIDSTTSKAFAMARDPKILTSQFTYYKLVYDSYSTSFGAENLAGNSFGIVITFTPSSSISSSLIFEARPASGSWRNVAEDYPFLIASDRNNEIPLYSSAWFDYLRNGYNYDKKKNMVADTSTAMGAIASAVGSVLSIVGGAGLMASGGGAAAGAGLIAGGVTGIVSSAAGAATSIWSTEVGQGQKESLLKKQASSVQSINDLSLFKKYGEGALKWCLYEPREDYRAQLENLFFYKGYARKVYGIPNLHARTSFDYFEGVPSWNSAALENAQAGFLDDLTNRIGQGVTILHRYENEWDFDQSKNNREVTE